MTAASMLALPPLLAEGDNKALALGFSSEYLKNAQPMERV